MVLEPRTDPARTPRVVSAVGSASLTGQILAFMKKKCRTLRNIGNIEQQLAHILTQGAKKEDATSASCMEAQYSRELVHSVSLINISSKPRLEDFKSKDLQEFFPSF